MRITLEQETFLKDLKCERLSSDPNNMYLVDTFINRRNPSFEQTLQNEAMEEDDEGNLSCEFMYQETKDLEDRQKQFFDNFNFIRKKYNRHRL